MDNTIEKRIQSLNDRLSYTRDIFAGKQHRRIQVALERNFILSQCTNLSETDCPVETHRIGTDL